MQSEDTPKFWNLKELSQSKRHSLCPLTALWDASSHSLNITGSHTCPNGGLHALLPAICPSHPNPSIWFGTTGVYGKGLLSQQRGPAEWLLMGLRKGGLTMSPCSQFRGPCFSPGGDMWSARSICLPALAAFWVIGQLEILNLAEISILQGKKSPQLTKIYIIYFSYCIKWLLLIPLLCHLIQLCSLLCARKSSFAHTHCNL